MPRLMLIVMPETFAEIDRGELREFQRAIPSGSMWVDTDIHEKAFALPTRRIVEEYLLPAWSAIQERRR